MKISPKYSSFDWKSVNLNVNSPLSDWEKAINIFQDRINGRFFNQVKLIENQIFSGFAIMSLDCLLIETLNQFWLGIDDTNHHPQYTRPIGRNWMSFRDFFHRSSHFSTFFPDDVSKVFYEQVRCGLLHQAETKQGTLINFKKSTMVNKIDISDINKGIEVNRKLFHAALIQEFEDYCKKLLNSSESAIRQNFINKMNLICR
jgi:hypothetical protein